MGKAEDVLALRRSGIFGRGLCDGNKPYFVDGAFDVEYYERTVRQ